MTRCAHKGCAHFVPSKEEIDVFRACNLISDGEDLEKLLAWSMGCCSPRCCVRRGAEILLDGMPSNVVPMVRR